MHTLPVSHFLHFEQLENDQLGKFFDSCAADGAECLSLTRRSSNGWRRSRSASGCCKPKAPGPASVS